MLCSSPYEDQKRGVTNIVFNFHTFLHKIQLNEWLLGVRQSDKQCGCS
jgi:hypothetical protein